MIPKSFFQGLRPVLEKINPNVLMLGEENDSELMQNPYELDYGWNMQGKLAPVANGADASQLQTVWEDQLSAAKGWPDDTLHMALLQDWDLGEDLQVYGGIPNTLDAAVFNFTSQGVPLLFAGEEVGNDNSADNTHNVVDWNSPNAAQFMPFYTQLLKLRNSNLALQQGVTTWETNSAPSQVVTYIRSGGDSEYLIEINFSNSAATGTVTVPDGGTWQDVSVSGSPGGTTHSAPPTFSLQGHDFAIFQHVAGTP
jgi:glycosidase